MLGVCWPFRCSLLLSDPIVCVAMCGALPYLYTTESLSTYVFPLSDVNLLRRRGSGSKEVPHRVYSYRLLITIIGFFFELNKNFS